MVPAQVNRTRLENRRRPLRFAALSLLIALAAMSAAGLAALLPLFDRLFSSSNLWRLQALAAWVLEGDRYFYLSGGLALLAILFLWLARRVTLGSALIYSASGCPHCQAGQLVRVSRRRRHRFLARLAALPIGNFICRDCSWEGLRLHGLSGAEAPPQSGDRPAGQPEPPTRIQPEEASAANERSTISPEGIFGESWVRRPEVLQGGRPAHVRLEAARSDAAVLAAAGQEAVAAAPIAPARPAAAPWLDFAARPIPVALAYLLALTAAEVIATLISPVTGVVAHMVLMSTLILHAALIWAQPMHRFLLALTLVPMIRVISLSLPLVDFPLVYWFFITSVPLFAAAYVVMRELDFSWGEVIGFSWRGLPLQLLIGSGGILLGYVEYLILEPEPLVPVFSWREIWLPALILLISTGFLEEYIFRFLLQRTSIEQLGAVMGVVYVALFFAVLHIGYRSVADFVFVLLAGLFFGWMAYKTGSIIGVTIAHGVTNIVLFLIVPFVALGGGLPLEQEIRDFAVPYIEQWAPGLAPGIEGQTHYVPDGKDRSETHFVGDRLPRLVTSATLSGNRGGQIAAGRHAAGQCSCGPQLWARQPWPIRASDYW